jgi:hypothetical protein
VHGLIGSDMPYVTWDISTNRDHTLFYKHSECRIAILAVYVDDIIITGDDELEISQLKKNLRKEFEVKILANQNTFSVLKLPDPLKG